MNNSAYTDKFMVVDRLKEGPATALFYESYTGLANCIAQYHEDGIARLMILKSRNSESRSWRTIELIPKFTIEFLDSRYSYFKIKPLDGLDSIPFGVPTDGDLYDAVRSKDTDVVYDILLREYSHMLLDLDLVHDLDPV